MKNKSDTNLLRHYCNCHRDSFLDVGRVHDEHFKDISESVFRKYVSRLTEEGILQPVSKGLLYIGYSISDNLDSKIRSFFGARNIHFGDSLLYELGIIDKKPEYECLRCEYGNKKRHVRKYYFWPLSFFSLLGPKYLIELIDLIDQFNKISEDDMGKYLYEVGERIKQYDDKDLRRIHIDYKKSTYLKLEYMLNQLHISNTVMQWYEYRKGFSN